jgi:hypothetical protein
LKKKNPDSTGTPTKSNDYLFRLHLSLACF